MSSMLKALCCALLLAISAKGDAEFKPFECRNFVDSYRNNCPLPKESDYVEPFGAAKEKDFPSMAFLKYDDIESPCSGTLISDRLVLTVARCIKKNVPSKVILGITSRNATNGHEYNIEKTVAYPDPSQKLLRDDIAIIQLKEKVEFSESVQPACLQQEPMEYSKFLVAGWGLDKLNGKLRETLKKVQLEYFDDEECRKVYGDSPRYDAETQICAGNRKKDGPDACQGDSGGPLIVKHPKYCAHVLVGIISYGKGCGIADTPGVYTRIHYPSYLEWIKKFK